VLKHRFGHHFEQCGSNVPVVTNAKDEAPEPRDTSPDTESTAPGIDSPQPETTSPVTVQGRYDPRQGAGGYAPIIGALGALAVPGIVILFTTPTKPTPHQLQLMTLAAGFLIVTVIASLVGSISLAAIAAEQELTANIPAASIRVAVPVVISIVDMLAAFEVLSAIYLTESETLFALIAAAGGACAVFFTAFLVGDSYYSGPVDAPDRERYIRRPWIRSYEEAYKYADIATAVGLAPIVLGMFLRGFHETAPVSTTTINCMILTGLVLAIAGALMGNRRVSHLPSGIQIPLQPAEAFGIPFTLGLYVLLLMIFLP
jgi:hypothetical protein